MSETVQLAEKEPPEWLLRTWVFAGRKQQYEAHEADWRSEYPNLWQLVREAKKTGLIDARSTPEPEPRWPDAVPDVHLIMLKPRTLEILKAATREKPGPKTHATQITIDGREIDLRNRANFDLVNARIEDVENVAHSYLHQIRNNPTKNQRRACMCQLHRVMLLRGKEISRPLYGSICLRLGMPLPGDFWHLSPEMLPNVGKTRSTPSFPLNPEEERFDSL